jgi:large subunit ribosomal protein L15
MPKRKTQKMRGSKTHGYGAKKKHRGKGSKGGKGYGGSTKHKRSYIYTHEPEHFGHKGFHSLRKKDVVVNIRDLEKMSKGKNELDLNEMGFTKLLSEGEISKALTIKVKKFSKKAKEKIESVGGKIISE